MSALILISDSTGNHIQARALSDTCTTANFITENLVTKLNLPTQACSIPIEAVNRMQTLSKHVKQIYCKSLNNKFQRSLTFFTINQITKFSPSEIFPRESISMPKNLKLTDPQVHIPRPIDVLIGSGTTLSLLSIGQINLSENNCDLIMQKTLLGWVIAGGVNTDKNVQSISCKLTDLSNQLTRFWMIEDVGSKDSRSLDDSMCESHYQKHTTRNAEGRYVVKLPFRIDNVDFGNSRNQTYKRFLSLQRRLNVDAQLKEEYCKVMQEYIDLGHMVHVTNEHEPGYYLPHHPMIKSSSTSTKMRVILDASTKTERGISLNGVLLTDPIIQDNIFTILLSFRTYVYVMTSDITRVHPEHNKFHKFCIIIIIMSVLTNFE
uniref:Uncharacterized protein n=1 Tax=Xenopsylla cheopis TaxID=163159 RepID=A0A6M2DRZ0_XENCH